jgi:hypothetical protein
MAIKYETLEQTLIPNTTMTKKYIDDVFKAYDVAPNNGYVLHDNTLDVEEFDPETYELTGEIKLGYYPIARSIGANYDFDNTTIIDGYTAYGEREFFARPIEEGTDNESEVI